MDILRKAVVGSTLHRLNTPESDVDTRIIYRRSLRDLLSLTEKEPVETANEDGDVAFFELGKFFKMCLTGNATALEILYSDLGEFSPDWQIVTDNRQSFLDSKKIRNAHCGYIKSVSEDLDRVYKTYKSKKGGYIKTWLGGYRTYLQGMQLLQSKWFSPNLRGTISWEPLMELKRIKPEFYEGVLGWLKDHLPEAVRESGEGDRTDVFQTLRFVLDDCIVGLEEECEKVEFMADKNLVNNIYYSLIMNGEK